MAENGLNRVMIIGRLGADPELRMTTGGQAVLKMRVAVGETYLDRNKVRQERTEWVSCVLWGKRGEALGKILTKGDRVFVEGRLSTRSYDDKEGNKKFSTEVNVNEVILCGGNRGGGGGGQKPASVGGSYDDSDYGGSDKDDDIPFVHCDIARVGERWWRF